MSDENEESKSWENAGVFIPAGLFIGMGVGWALGYLVQGVLVGLGLGFLGMGIARMVLGKR